MAAEKIIKPQSRCVPWATTIVIALAFIAWLFSRTLTEVLIYDRAALLRGAVWRLWSGHLVHFSIGHLGWDLLVVGITGTWIECARFRGGRLLWVVVPPCISLILFFSEPSLARYGGLSGMATASVIFACLSAWRQHRSRRLLWAAIMTLVAIKTGVEFASQSAVFASFEGGEIHAAPLSHLAGACSAIAYSFFVRPPKNKTGKS